MTVKYVICKFDTSTIPAGKKCSPPEEAKLYNTNINQNWLTLSIADPSKTSIQLNQLQAFDDNGNIITQVNYQDQYVTNVNVVVFDDLGTNKFIFTKAFLTNKNNYDSLAKSADVAQANFPNFQPLITN
jgi:hypothetical protein